MAFNQFTRNLESVTDPTDWQQSRLPALGALDGLLRCFVCKEFFRAPVITACNHSFCSQCIREALVASGQCPLCGSEQYESSLRRDPHLEEVAGCFSHLRPALLDLVRPPSVPDVIEIASDEEPLPGAVNASRNLPKTSSLEVMDQKNTNGLKVDKGTLQTDINLASSLPRTPSESASGNLYSRSNRAVDANVSNSKSASPANKRLNNTSMSATTTKVDNSASISSQLVLCPVCNRQMSAEKLQTTHLDSCLTDQVLPSKKRKSSISSFFLSLSGPSNTPKTITLPDIPKESYYERELKRAKAKSHTPEIKKLPKLDFASLSTPKVKEKLSFLGLPTSGTRAMLELRYNHYYILHNSNLDGNHPVSDKVLRQRLNRWELSNLAFSGGGDSSLFQTASSLSSRSISDKDFPIKLWNKQNDAEYRRLTRLARESAKRDKNAREVVKNSDESTADSTVN